MQNNAMMHREGFKRECCNVAEACPTSTLGERLMFAGNTPHIVKTVNTCGAGNKYPTLQ